jgi:hypothetical protein
MEGMGTEMVGALPNACVGVGWLGFFLGLLQELAVGLCLRRLI